MRPRAALVPALLAAVLLASPPAAASGFTFGADRHMESGASDGATILFDMPVALNADGFVYAKLLVTDGNAVNDGSRANGTLSPPSGWRLDLAWTRASGVRADLGTVVDGTPTTLVPVRAGELDHLVATVHVPPGASAHGAAQKVYVALAFRVADAGPDADGTSGGQLDEARAITLTLKFDGSPANATTPTPPVQGATGGGASSGGASGDGGAPGGSGASGGEGAGASSDDGLAAPPVTGIPLGASGSGVSASLAGAVGIPTWFLVWAVVILTVLTLTLAMMTFVLFALLRRGPARVRFHVVEKEESVRAKPPRVLQVGDER